MRFAGILSAACIFKCLRFGSRGRSRQGAHYNFVLPRISSDGRRVVFGVEEEDPQIWIYNLSRDTLTRLTFQA